MRISDWSSDVCSSDLVRPLKPFIDTAPFDAVRPLRGAYRAALASEQQLDPDLPWLLAAAMMRPGDKLKSYQILAQALRALPDSSAERRVGKEWFSTCSYRWSLDY